MGGGTSYKIHNLFIQRYNLRYKTHWSFKFILEKRILLYLLPNILYSIWNPFLIDCHEDEKIARKWTSNRWIAIGVCIYSYSIKLIGRSNLFSRIGFSFATQYILNLKHIFDWLSRRRKNYRRSNLFSRIGFSFAKMNFKPLYSQMSLFILEDRF